MESEATMPALIAHNLFAERTASALPGQVLKDEEEKLAYALGAQGPDPFYFRWTGPVTHNHACHVLAHDMHAEKVSDALTCLRKSVDCLVSEDQRLGRAFVLGLFSHYWLDSHAHPFIYAQQYALIEADPELASSQSEVHAVIEADLDSWLLWLLRREAAETGKASLAALETTDRIGQVGSALFSQMAHEIFGLSVNGEQYGYAVRDYRRVYHALEPKGRLSELALTNAEEMARTYSMLGALVHPAHAEAACASGNTAHHEWKDLATGASSTKDFLQVFEDAEASWPEAASSFLAGEPLAPLVAGRNYNGEIMGEGESAPATEQMSAAAD